MNFIKCSNCGKQYPNSYASCPFCSQSSSAPRDNTIKMIVEGIKNILIDYSKKYLDEHSDEYNPDNISTISTWLNTMVVEQSNNYKTIIEYNLAEKLLINFLDSIPVDYYYKKDYFEYEQNPTIFKSKVINHKKEEKKNGKYVTKILCSKKIGPNTTIIFPREADGIVGKILEWEEDNSRGDYYTRHTTYSILCDKSFKKIVIPSKYKIYGEPFQNCIVSEYEIGNECFISNESKGNLILNRLILRDTVDNLPPTLFSINELYIYNIKSIDKPISIDNTINDIYIYNSYLHSNYYAKKYHYDLLSNYLQDSSYINRYIGIHSWYMSKLYIDKYDLMDNNVITIPNNIKNVFFNRDAFYMTEYHGNLIVNSHSECSIDFDTYTIKKIYFDKTPNNIPVGCDINVEGKNRIYYRGKTPYISVDNFEELRYLLPKKGSESYLVRINNQPLTEIDYPDVKFWEDFSINKISGLKLLKVYPINNKCQSKEFSNWCYPETYELAEGIVGGPLTNAENISIPSTYIINDDEFISGLSRLKNLEIYIKTISNHKLLLSNYIENIFMHSSNEKQWNVKFETTKYRYKDDINIFIDEQQFQIPLQSGKENLVIIENNGTINISVK